MSDHDMQDPDKQAGDAHEETAPNFDQIQRFLFDATNVRGEIVTLDKAYAEVLDRHAYPQAISRQLGEMLAAVALLTETIKLDGTDDTGSAWHGDRASADGRVQSRR